jgi:hypothetical protein
MITASDLENRLLSVAVASPLGQAVTYTPALSGVAATIRGVLNREYIETLSRDRPARRRRHSPADGVRQRPASGAAAL